MAEPAVPMDPHVVLAEILAKLDRMTKALEGIDENLDALTDYAEAVDNVFCELHLSDKPRPLTAGSFLREYGQAREAQAEGEDPDDDEPGSLPGPGVG